MATTVAGEMEGGRGDAATATPVGAIGSPVRVVMAGADGELGRLLRPLCVVFCFYPVALFFSLLLPSYFFRFVIVLVLGVV